jgi:hypothetical protein
MKPEKERAAPAQRETKIASLSSILAEIRRIWPCERAVVAENSGLQNQLTRRMAAQGMALSPICFHPFCNSPQRVRSTATFQTIESRNNHPSSPASRRSPSIITTLPASKLPAARSLLLFSAGSRERNTMRRPASANEIFSSSPCDTACYVVEPRLHHGAPSPRSTTYFRNLAATISPTQFTF